MKRVLAIGKIETMLVGPERRPVRVASINAFGIDPDDRAYAQRIFEAGERVDLTTLEPLRRKA